MRTKIICTLLLIFILTSCQNYPKTTSEPEPGDNAGIGIYYLIEENEDSSYSYTIFLYGGQIIEQSETEQSQPVITKIDDDILRLEISKGLNHLILKYFRLENGISSLQYITPGLFADIHEDGEVYVAYYDLVDGITNIVVYDVFSNQLVDTIERDFLSPSNPGNEIKFISRNQLFAKYYVVKGATNDEYIYEGKGSLEMREELFNF